MKAEISEKGNLDICAENGTEAYALKKWFYHFVTKEPIVVTISISFNGEPIICEEFVKDNGPT